MSTYSDEPIEGQKTSRGDELVKKESPLEEVVNTIHKRIDIMGEELFQLEKRLTPVSSSPPEETVNESEQPSDRLALGGDSWAVTSIYEIGQRLNLHIQSIRAMCSRLDI